MIKQTSLIKSLSLLLLIGLYACSAGSEKGVRESEPQALIPAGFEILQSDTLSTGGELFVINALRYQNEDSVADIHSEAIRPITILKKRSDRGYELLARNDSVILCHRCGGMFGDPWDGMYTEEDGSFTVNHAGGSSDRWTRNIKFQYNASKQGWFMVSDRGASYSTLDPENSFEMTIYTPGDSLGLTPFTNFKTGF